MMIETLLTALFPQGHQISFDGSYFSGLGKTAQGAVFVLGTKDSAPIGVELAHRLSEDVLDVIKTRPGCSILLLVDTEGQRLSHRDELLGINAYMAHLAQCIDLARRSGHRIIGLVWSQAVSGGFLASSLLADECYALPEAEIRVMNLPSMSKVTKIPLAQLEALSQTSPVFAPGVENYMRMGAIAKVWHGDLSHHLVEALSQFATGDLRRLRGKERGGRTMALDVSERVRSDGQ